MAQRSSVAPKARERFSAPAKMVVSLHVNGVERKMTIAPWTTLLDALRLMEDRPSQISVLPVVDPANGQCLGLIRLHDIYRAELECPADETDGARAALPLSRAPRRVARVYQENAHDAGG